MRKRPSLSIASPLQEASEDELGQLVDEVLGQDAPQAKRHGSDKRKDLRFHGDGRSIAQSREAEAQLPEPLLAKMADPLEGLNEWYIAMEGRSVGPLSLKTMAEFWEDGTIDPEMLCWRAGQAEWQSVRSTRALVEALSRQVIAESSLQAVAKSTGLSGSWKPVGGQVLARVQREQGTPTRPFPPPPLPAAPVDMNEVIRSTVRQLTPLIQPTQAEPKRSSVVPVALLSGAFSGLLVAFVFLLMRSTHPSPPPPVEASPPSSAALPLPPSSAPPSAQAVQATDSVESKRSSLRTASRAGSRRPTRRPPRGQVERKVPAATGPTVAALDFEEDQQEEITPPLQSALETDRLSQSEIAAVVVGQKASWQECMSQFAPSNPAAPTRLVMRWSVDSLGQVSDARAQSEDFQGGPLEGCVAKLLGSWKFPAHAQASDGVVFPFPISH